METSTTAELDCTDRIAKRAEWEAFEFSLLGRGKVEVVNKSHPDDEVDDHTYVVEIEDGTPVECTCPYTEYHERACKHQVAVARREPVIEAVIESERTQLVTDGGQMSTVDEEDACPNGQVGCNGPESDELPCFGCYREGNR